MAELDIVNLILDDHASFRRDFATLLARTDESDPGARWNELAARLEVHASGEEAVLYPQVLSQVDDAEDDTEHAVKDHNKIRDAVRAVADHEVGTPAWWDAVGQAQYENNDHLDEEERDVLPPFRSEVSDKTRSALGQEWLAFRDEHFGARGLSGRDKDPEAYVERNAP